jgi:hypothetical protein
MSDNGKDIIKRIMNENIALNISFPFNINHIYWEFFSKSI